MSQNVMATAPASDLVSGHQTYHLGELFAGAGGMALGASWAVLGESRFQHVWINDVDPDACESFQINLPIATEHVHCCDVKDLDLSLLPAIDGLVFGFPCNDFSVVGERRGIDGHYGGLYHWGIRALRALTPSFFVAENVSGIASSGGALDIILGALGNAGYRVFSHKYRFEEYDVPQARHRIIIVGFRKNLGIRRFEHPAPTSKDSPRTCREALRSIAPDSPNNERTKQSPRVVERLKYIKPGQNVFNADLPEHLKLAMRSNAKISQVYRRLKPDRPAYTVTGSGGGGTHVYHWRENRALTNRERARLQTFPDDFRFLGGKESVRRQIGMAVPPMGARAVFRAVLETLLSHGVPSQC